MITIIMRTHMVKPIFAAVRKKIFPAGKQPAQKSKVFLPVVREYVVCLRKQPDLTVVYLVQNILVQVAERPGIRQFQGFRSSAGCAHFLQVHKDHPGIDIISLLNAPRILLMPKMRFLQAEPVGNPGNAHPVHFRIIQVGQGPGNHQVAVQIQAARFAAEKLRKEKTEVGHLNRIRTEAARLIRGKTPCGHGKRPSGFKRAARKGGNHPEKRGQILPAQVLIHGKQNPQVPVSFSRGQKGIHTDQGIRQIIPV